MFVTNIESWSLPGVGFIEPHYGSIRSTAQVFCERKHWCSKSPPKGTNEKNAADSVTISPSASRPRDRLRSTQRSFESSYMSRSRGSSRAQPGVVDESRHTRHDLMSLNFAETRHDVEFIFLQYISIFRLHSCMNFVWP